MYGGNIFSRIFHFPDEWREAAVWNCSCVNDLKCTVLHRTVPRHRVNGKPLVPTRNGSIQNRSKVSCKRSLSYLCFC